MNSLLTPLRQRHIHVGYVLQSSRPGNGRYFCTPVDQPKLNTIHQAIQKSILQTQFTSPLDLDYLVVCDGLSVNKQNIGGIPVPTLNTLVISAPTTASASQSVHIFWHELFHYLEIKSRTYEDHAWQQQFQGYDEHYGIHLGSDVLLGSGSRGFINRYSQTFAHEDRAEIAAWLLSDQAMFDDFLSSNNDTLIAQKVRYIKQKLRYLGVE